MRTLVLGASLKEIRYSNRAIRLLREKAFEVEAIGLREGRVVDVDIQTGEPDLKDIHTITMYLGARNQVDLYDYLLGLNPKRIIFNPGAENNEFAEMAKEQGINVEMACTLVMLNIGNYAFDVSETTKHQTNTK